jgi:hypothetical protein
MIINRTWLNNVYQQEAGNEVAVAPASTDTPATDAGTTTLTGTAAAASTATTDESASAETNTDVTTDEDATNADETDGDPGDAGDGDVTLDATAFTVPEGMTLDAEMIEKAMPLFKDAGINQEQSQKFLDLYAAKMQESEQGKLDSFNQMRQDWANQAKSDPEYGGDKFDENIASAKAALDKFGNPELLKVLDSSGMGDHPEMIRFMMSVGRLTQEDTPGNGAKNHGQAKSHLDILYPSS